MPAMSSVRLTTGLQVAGLLAVLVALAWWAVVYTKVVDGNYMSYGEAAPCALMTTDRCSLAQALCTTGHTFGIRRYSATLLWIGVGLAALGLLADGRRRR